MTVIDQATNSLEKVPRGVWLASIGVGGGIGVLYLWRHRGAPADTSESADYAASTPVYSTPDFSSPVGYAGDGGVGGGTVQSYDPQAVVQPGTNPIPFGSIVDVLTTLWGLQPPGAADTGGGMPVSGDPTDTHTAPVPAVPAVAPAAPAAVAPAPVPTAPPRPVANKPQPAACPASHPFSNPEYKANPWGCYRVVLIGHERWHYRYDGTKVRVA